MLLLGFTVLTTELEYEFRNRVIDSTAIVIEESALVVPAIGFTPLNRNDTEDSYITDDLHDSTEELEPLNTPTLTIAPGNRIEFFVPGE